MIVVADTSVLINLCRVGQGGLVQQLFQEVFIPPEVAAELRSADLRSGAFLGHLRACRVGDRRSRAARCALAKLNQVRVLAPQRQSGYW